MVPIFLFVCSFACAIAGRVPDYINKCNYDENTISQCVLDNVPKVLPHLKDGIKGLHLPPLVPFHLEELTIEPSPGLVLKLKNLEIYGLDKVNMTQLTIKSPNMEFKMHFDEVRFQGDFDINGKLLILPIQGKCKCFMALQDFSVDYFLTFGESERNGKKYFTTDNHKIIYDSTRMTSDLEKLFAEPTLGKQLKQFMEENWKEINDEFRPVMTETILQIVKNLFNSVTNSMPLNELFIV
ncbi:circadian clock-controlled protein daywake-like [Atheta coriaria]|uniref:circadian clock-controlled protein daywake-like n=1 Tax=Dalotia coriaria TaxID=877792 RepID=UPI0031F3BA15